MKNKNFIIPFFTVLVISAFIIGVSVPNNPSSSDNNAQNIVYDSSVCVYKNGDLVGPCSSNVLYNLGAEAIESYLADGDGAGDAFDFIELGDAAAAAGEPEAAQGEAYTAHNADGLAKAAGTVLDVGNGNWSVSYTFTSTGEDQLTNVTRLLNGDADTLAGNSFTLVTLQTSDQLTINWTVWVA